MKCSKCGFEINTAKGRFLLPCNGIQKEDIRAFQQMFYQRKRNS